MMNAELAIRNDTAELTIADVMTLAQAFVQSGYFKDASDPAKAVVKIMYGRDLGIGAMAAMNGVFIVEGKPSLSAGLIGALIMRSGKYCYRVRKCDATGASLEFFERDNGAWTSVGMATFEVADAKAAGLAGKQNWSRYASDMMFARALTRGARRYCPDVFLGPVYYPEELGGDFTPETGEAIAELPVTILEPMRTGAPEVITPPQAPPPETHTDADADHIEHPPAPKSWKDELGKCADGKCVLACMRWIRAVEPTGFRRSHAIAHAYKLLANFAPDEAGLNWVYDQASVATDMATKEHHEVAEHIAAKRQLLADEAAPDDDDPDDDSDLMTVGEEAGEVMA